jgi:molybdopterin synthase catalytic subunit
MLRLTEEVIDFAEVTETVRTAGAGAVVLFLGTVRELTDGHRTDALEYDAYVPMAEKKMAELEASARKKWPLDRVSIVHRLGHLDPGEVSVAVAVSSAHRREAFVAGQFLIDELKATVPIWKKEHRDGGVTQWVHPGLEAPSSPIPPS